MTERSFPARCFLRIAPLSVWLFLTHGVRIFIPGRSAINWRIVLTND